MKDYPYGYLEQTQCPDVLISKSIFKPQFFEDLSREILTKFDIKNDTPLSNIEFETEWHEIINFLIEPGLCYHFTGMIDYFSSEFASIHNIITNYEYGHKNNYDVNNADNDFNILMPLIQKDGELKGQITFSRY